jgi:hypothetical protein
MIALGYLVCYSDVENPNHVGLVINDLGCGMFLVQWTKELETVVYHTRLRRYGNSPRE